MQAESGSSRDIPRSTAVELSWHFSFRVTFWVISESQIPSTNSAVGSVEGVTPCHFEGCRGLYLFI